MGLPTTKTIQRSVEIAAGTAKSYHVAWPHLGKWQITAVRFAPDTAVALDGTNYRTATVSANPSGSFVAFATHTTNTGGTASVLGTTDTLTLTAGAAAVAARQIERDDQIQFTVAHTGTGAAWDGTYIIEAEKLT